MVPTKYIAKPAPVTNQRQFISNELQSVSKSIVSLVELLKALDVPIEIGPADSAGAGYRTLRIPN